MGKVENQRWKPPGGCSHSQPPAERPEGWRVENPLELRDTGEGRIIVELTMPEGQKLTLDPACHAAALEHINNSTGSAHPEYACSLVVGPVIIGLPVRVGLDLFADLMEAVEFNALMTELPTVGPLVLELRQRGIKTSWAAKRLRKVSARMLVEPGEQDVAGHVLQFRWPAGGLRPLAHVLSDLCQIQAQTEESLFAREMKRVFGCAAVDRLLHKIREVGLVEGVHRR